MYNPSKAGKERGIACLFLFLLLVVVLSFVFLLILYSPPLKPSEINAPWSGHHIFRGLSISFTLGSEGLTSFKKINRYQHSQPFVPSQITRRRVNRDSLKS